MDELQLIVLLALGLIVLIAAFLFARVYIFVKKQAGYIDQVQKELEGRVLAEDFVEQLRDHARKEVSHAVQASGDGFERSMSESLKPLTQGLSQQAHRQLERELKDYKQAVAESKAAITNAIEETRISLEQVRQDLEQNATRAVEAEKARLIGKLDSHLDQIVNQYLYEALEGQIDLSLQMRYIMRNLEASKEQIKKDIDDAV